MTAPIEPSFVTFPRGQLRDEMLAHFRNGLRRLVNPVTKNFYSEEEIRQATQEGSRDYLRFDALDLGLQAGQQRARFTAQQTNPAFATSSWLRGFHCPLWGITPLGASSGIGDVTWAAPPGRTFKGSTNLGDPTATTCVDPTGNVFQVLANVTVPDDAESATVRLIAVPGGAKTNPGEGTIFTKSANVPLGAAPTCTAIGQFAGGFDAELDQDLLDRLLDRIKRKPASGNRAQFRAWARGLSTAIQTAFVYPCLFNPGSVCVAIVGKRGTPGPLARIDSVRAVLADARRFLTPPTSPVVPPRAFVLVHIPVSDPVDMALSLKMRTGTVGGWADSQPWPSPPAGSAFCRVTSVVDAQTFDVVSGTVPLASPSLMVWNSAESSFVPLAVGATVTPLSGNAYRVNLSESAPATLGIGSVICPYTQLLDAIGQSAENYFDSLGPGEMIDLATSPRAGRAFRWPEPADEYPYEAGGDISDYLRDSLGRALSTPTVKFISHTVPTLPADISQEGPRMLTINDFGVYAP